MKKGDEKIIMAILFVAIRSGLSYCLDVRIEWSVERYNKNVFIIL